MQASLKTGEVHANEHEWKLMGDVLAYVAAHYRDATFDAIALDCTHEQILTAQKEVKAHSCTPAGLTAVEKALTYASRFTEDVFPDGDMDLITAMSDAILPVAPVVVEPRGGYGS